MLSLMEEVLELLNNPSQEIKFLCGVCRGLIFSLLIFVSQPISNGCLNLTVLSNLPTMGGI
jgi:hypothetical protein